MKLVCTDLDRTLLPNGNQPESLHARAILWHLLASHNTSLAFVSGRDLSRVLDAIDQYELAMPKAIVADVGTNIYWRKKDNWEFDEAWQTRIGANWKGHDSEYVQQLLESVTLLEDQNVDRQSRFKCSFFYRYGEVESKLTAKIQSILLAEGIKSALLFSHDPITDQGLLDVVPKSATKREAVAYIAKQSRIRLGDTLFAGDSGNDITAILADHPGVLVANADQATKDVIKKQCASMADTSNIYQATGNLEVQGHQNLNGNYAAGIVEALLHYRPDWKQCLDNNEWVQKALA